MCARSRARPAHRRRQRPSRRGIGDRRGPPAPITPLMSGAALSKLLGQATSRLSNAITGGGGRSAPISSGDQRHLAPRPSQQDRLGALGRGSHSRRRGRWPSWGMGVSSGVWRHFTVAAGVERRRGGIALRYPSPRKRGERSGEGSSRSGERRVASYFASRTAFGDVSLTALASRSAKPLPTLWLGEVTKARPPAGIEESRVSILAPCAGNRTSCRGRRAG